MIKGDDPFVLLDDARQGGGATLFRSPRSIVQALSPDEVDQALGEARDGLRQNLHAAGFLTYEAGYSFDDKLAEFRADARPDALPLAWFGLFEHGQELSAAELADFLPPPDAGRALAPEPLIDEQAYAALVSRVQDHIRAGDIYQANLTFQSEVRTAGAPLAIYSAIRKRASGGHCALLFTGTDWILSFSPELFFSFNDGLLTARPMKGTARRTGDADADQAAAHALASDSKQRAENLMIVDLLRNDLARISKPGTVQVPALFAIEAYPTVLQMTSTVTAKALPDVDAVAALRSLFPCGSITGAPKLRAMETIFAFEERLRGIYTGAIGHIAPDGSASFNVAIRTLWMREGDEIARVGLGSGIVADSKAADEWQECLAKGAFIASPQPDFDLFETMRFEPSEGIIELERHLDRLKRSADSLGFAFNRHGTRNELQAATFRLREPRRIRLMLAASGAIAIETRSCPATKAAMDVAIQPLPVDSADFRLRHKTTDRAFYDKARMSSGRDEVVFVDAEGRLTEGSFTNIFMRRGAKLLTPPLARGLLPGILREKLIEDGRAMEADLRPADLKGGFLLGNSMRGLVEARISA